MATTLYISQQVLAVLEFEAERARAMGDNKATRTLIGSRLIARSLAHEAFTLTQAVVEVLKRSRVPLSADRIALRLENIPEGPREFAGTSEVAILMPLLKAAGYVVAVGDGKAYTVPA